MVRLGIDIDGVLANFDIQYRRLLKSRFGIILARRDVTRFNIPELVGLSQKDSEKIIEEFRERRLWENLSLVRGVLPFIKYINANCSVTVVTSRPLELKEMTEKWLARKKIRYERLMLTAGGSKWTAFEKTAGKPDYFIEDCLEYALSLADKGIQVLLLDCPWNRGPVKHPNIKRMAGFDEIVRVLNKKKRQG